MATNSPTIARIRFTPSSCLIRSAIRLMKQEGPPVSGPLISILSVVALDLGFEIGDHVKEALIEAAVGGDGVFDRDVGDVEAVKDGDAAPLFLVHHVDGVQAVALARTRS